MCPVFAIVGVHLVDSRVQTDQLNQSKTVQTGPGLNQWSPAQRADGDEGLAGGRVQPNRLHQTEVQEAERKSTADV